MKYFTNAMASLREQPLRTGTKIQEILPGTPVEVIGEHSGWLEVEYQLRRGWIFASLAEPYVENLPKNIIKIDNQTPTPYDFEQYIIHAGIKQTNLCGELCCCLALGVSLSGLMDVWEIKAPKLWARIKGAGKFTGTSREDLIGIFDAFTLQVSTLESKTLDPLLKRSRYTVDGLRVLAETGYPICGVKMDGNTGYLRGQGIGHWVVVVKVEPERTGGIVTVFNPAPNRWEQYTWREWNATAPQVYGVWLEKG